MKGLKLTFIALSISLSGCQQALDICTAPHIEQGLTKLFTDGEPDSYRSMLESTQATSDVVIIDKDELEKTTCGATLSFTVSGEKVAGSIRYVVAPAADSEHPTILMYAFGDGVTELSEKIDRTMKR